MDPILVHRRTVLGKALGVGLLLLAKATVPVAARAVPPFRKGEPELYGICRSLQDKYKAMEAQARDAPPDLRGYIEADMRKLEVPWRSQGCQSEFGSIALARIPLVPGGQLGPNPVAPLPVGVAPPKKPKKPNPVAPPPGGVVRVAGNQAGKRRRSRKRRS